MPLFGVYTVTFVSPPYPCLADSAMKIAQKNGRSKGKRGGGAVEGRVVDNAQMNRAWNSTTKNVTIRV